MSSITRHIGTYKATGSRVIVVFREIPDDTSRCLVVPSDSLPELFRDAVGNVVSHAGQGTKDLYEILHRETMPNGENMLSALHKYGLLKPADTSEILMHPTRNYTIPLNELNAQLRIIGDESNKVNESDIQKKFNPYQEKAEQLADTDAVNIAAKLMLEADDLETEAVRKRERAYKLRPELEQKYKELHAEPEPEPEVDVPEDEITESDALVKVSALVERFPAIADIFTVPQINEVVKVEEPSPTLFSIELAGISQRKATVALKEAWAVVNPGKVKK